MLDHRNTYLNMGINHTMVRVRHHLQSNVANNTDRCRYGIDGFDHLLIMAILAWNGNHPINGIVDRRRC